jgi:polysaccharide export outer membrane protein
MLYPNDVLDITVYGYPELSQQVRVSAGGGFVYPPLGTVHTAGLTVAQLEQQLTQQLQNGRLTQLQVGVIVKEHHNRHVHILGAVRSPGVYTLPGNASLLDLIAQANGLTSEAEAYILIYRAESESRPEALALVRYFQGIPSIRIDWRALVAGESATAIRIRSGDTVYVPRRRSAYAARSRFLGGRQTSVLHLSAVGNVSS